MKHATGVPGEKVLDDNGRMTFVPDRHDGAPRMARTTALALLGDVVYAVRFPDGTIKFGSTGNLYNRLNSLAYAEGDRPTLLGFRPGDYDDEWVIHNRLRAHRRGTRQEFYHPTEPVLAEVAAMRDELGLPALTS